MSPSFSLGGLFYCANRGKANLNFFNKILSFNKAKISEAKIKWEAELGLRLEERWWTEALARVNSSSSCARLNIMQLKVIHRAHLCNAKLAQIYSEVKPICTRCDKDPATLFHMFWSCRKMGRFWDFVHSTLSTVFNKHLSLCPLLAIFSIYIVTTQLNSQELDSIAFALLLARRRILISWKSRSPPSHSLWLRDVVLFLHLEKIKFSLRGSVDNFHHLFQVPPAASCRGPG